MTVLILLMKNDILLNLGHYLYVLLAYCTLEYRKLTLKATHGVTFFKKISMLLVRPIVVKKSLLTDMRV